MSLESIRTDAAIFLRSHFKSAQKKGTTFYRLVERVSPRKPLFYGMPCLKNFTWPGSRQTEIHLPDNKITKRVSASVKQPQKQNTTSLTQQQKASKPAKKEVELPAYVDKFNFVMNKDLFKKNDEWAQKKLEEMEPQSDSKSIKKPGLLLDQIAAKMFSNKPHKAYALLHRALQNTAQQREKEGAYDLHDALITLIDRKNYCIEFEHDLRSAMRLASGYVLQDKLMVDASGQRIWCKEDG